MTMEEQQGYLEAGEIWRKGLYYPLQHVWPMAFAWSFYIAQEEILDVRDSAEVPESFFLACDCEMLW